MFTGYSFEISKGYRRSVNLMNFFQHLKQMRSLELIIEERGEKRSLSSQRSPPNTLAKVQPSTGTGANYPCVMKSMWLIVRRFGTDP
jgi:hypothetical protein